MIDILSEVRALDVSRPALRRFGFTVGGVFLLIASWVLYRNAWSPTGWALGLGLAGGILVLGGLIVPTWLRPVFRVWMTIAFAMGFVMTRVLLTLVFFLLVTPIGLVLRLTGHDPMRRRLVREANATYWIAREDDASDRERMTRAW